MMSKSRWLVATTLSVLLAAVALVAAAPATAAESPNITKFEVTRSTDQAGAPIDLAVKIEQPVKDGTTAKGETVFREVRVDLPAGIVGNHQAVPACPMSAMAGLPFGKTCDASTQVGTVRFAGYIITTMPLYRLETNEEATTARFGFLSHQLSPTILEVRPRSEDDFGLRTVSFPIGQAQMSELEVQMWGEPYDASHDAERGGFSMGEMRTTVPFLSNGSECGVEQVAKLNVDSLMSPGVFTYREDSMGELVGCDQLDFRADATVGATSRATDSPTGLNVDLNVPQAQPGELVRPHVRDVVMDLPEGLGISPSGANGLVACTDAQLGLGVNARADCPAASVIGEVKVETPVIPEGLVGTMNVRESGDGELFRLVILANGPGIRMKIPGVAKADPATGKLRVEFLNNPQQPFSKLQVRLAGGALAPLATPLECGIFQTGGNILSWTGTSQPINSSFVIDRATNRADCAEAVKLAPSFKGGVDSALAGGSSNLAFQVGRQDGTARIGSLKNIQLPEGLLGHVGSVDLCDSAAADSGACPAGSQIGHVQVAAGSGPNPVWVPEAGKPGTSVFLTGPYKGAPYGLSIVVPAQAGPYDLGKVVVRSALHVDERTIQLTTGVDQSRVFDTQGQLIETIEGALPSMLRGVDLRIKQMRVQIDREGFIVNPTDCTPGQIGAEVVGLEGGSASVSDRFQVGGCAALDFAPRFNARILNKGRKSTLRSFHPRTRFAVVPHKGNANIGAARVVLPSSTILDQSNIGTTCTRAQMAANSCPEASIVGYARAWSPLLRRAVQGPVYLAANGGARPLPDLTAVMDGEIRVVLQGEIATRRGGGKARLQTTFRTVPDAPVSRFVLTMRGGKKRGLLVNSTDLCRTNERGAAVFHGQNGRTHRLRPRIATAFKGCAKVRRQARRIAQRKAARKAAVQAVVGNSAAREAR